MMKAPRATSTPSLATAIHFFADSASTLLPPDFHRADQIASRQRVTPLAKPSVSPMLKKRTASAESNSEGRIKYPELEVGGDGGIEVDVPVAVLVEGRLREGSEVAGGGIRDRL